MKLTVPKEIHLKKNEYECFDYFCEHYLIMSLLKLY